MKDHCPLCGSVCAESIPIGKALKIARVVSGLSREALADRLGYAFDTIERWEQGKHVPQPANRKLLMDWITSVLSSERLLGTVLLEYKVRYAVDVDTPST